MKKIISVCLSATLLISFVSSNIETNSKAATYRTEYTVYGDVNGDKVIDAFDIVEMRGRLVDGADYNSLLDLNHDEAVDAADLQLLQDYILGRIAIFDAYYYDDADTDGICDLFEIAFFETNPDSEDTDGDTLSDYDEIVYTKTLPTTKYTNGLSVTDAEDDTDSDKLTNAEEIKYGTLAFLEDSDDDDISDYDEINTYLTDPNDEDSDDDYIFDGDELAINLNPNNPSTDGVVHDSEYVISQNIAASSAALSTINNEDNSYELSIDTNSAGVAEKSISVSVSQYSGAFNENITGKAVDISYNENLKVENIKLNFTLKEDELIDNTAEDFMIFEYFPDKNYLLPVETEYDGNTVYIESPRVGTYCLVNTAELFEAEIGDEAVSTASALSLNNIADTGTKSASSSGSLVLDYELGETEVTFFVDISGCLDENLEETKKSIHDCSQAVFEHSDKAAVAIIGYYSNTSTGEQKIKVYSDSNSYNLFGSIESVDEALNSITPYTTNTNNDVNAAIYGLESLITDYGLHSWDCDNKYAFIVSDSLYTFTDSLGYKLVIPNTTCESLEAIYNESVQVNFLLSSANYNRTSAVKNLRVECEKYNFGIYSKSQLGNFATAAFSKIYSDAIVDLTTIPAAYTCSVTPNSIPDMVNRNAFINSLNGMDTSKVPEADADGNINYKDAAVDMGLADYDKNGNLEFENYRDTCEIDELTLKGYEQLMSELRTSTRLVLESVQITPFSEKIMFEDNDGDGLENYKDKSPDDPLDDHFKVIDTYDYNIENLISDEYQAVIEHGKQIYDSEENDTLALKAKNKISQILGGLLYVGGTTDFASLIGSEGSFGSTPHGSAALLHFLGNSGEDVFIKTFPITIALVDCQRVKYYDNMNSFFEMVENTIKPEYSYLFSTVTNLDRGEENSPDADIYTKSWKVDYHLGSGYTNQIATDWWLTFGGAQNALISEVSCSTSSQGELIYKAKIKYCIFDYYDWDEKFEDRLADLHKYGEAQNYRIFGCYETTIEWVEGSRYPKAQQTPDLNQLDFEGIKDTGLKELFSYGLDFYEAINYDPM